MVALLVALAMLAALLFGYALGRQQAAAVFNEVRAARAVSAAASAPLYPWRKRILFRQPGVGSFLHALSAK